jgi:hypothetical protein
MRFAGRHDRKSEDSLTDGYKIRVIEFPELKSQLTHTGQTTFQHAPAIHLDVESATPVTGGSTMPYYLTAGNNAPALVMGANLEVHYSYRAISLGASYRSPVWFRKFNWNR